MVTKAPGKKIRRVASTARSLNISLLIALIYFLIFKQDQEVDQAEFDGNLEDLDSESESNKDDAD